MSLSFGELLREYRQRKPGLSQAHLAALAGYDPSILARMSQGKKDLTGPSGRERVVRLLGVLCGEGVLVKLDEANALLAAAHMPPLYPGQPDEAALLQSLRIQPTPEAVAAPASIPHNLPAQLTAFIGREQAIAQIRQLLGHNRLVTLTGAGGVGKTRLAIQVGESFIAADLAGGVWLAQLAPLVDPALVSQTVVSVFQLPPDVERTPAEALVAHLADRQLLLIFDSCEHLIAACAELAVALLQACPRLRILATSREALGVPGEVIWRVPSLSLPAAAPPAFEHILGSESVQLFVQAATAAQPSFRLTPENADTVARICHRLDGIPLALEMAAAQTAVMALPEIAARLSDCFALLTSGRRTGLPRHRTLRATLEWSYDLLSEPERVLLARLAVFVDGCTADAAQAVCGDAPLPPAGVLPLLLQLAHKSLVVADMRGKHSRYRLLETIRQFAAQKLEGRAEADGVHERLGPYLESLAKRARGELDGSSVLEAELGNVRALRVWVRSHPGHAELMLRVVTAYQHFWNGRGYIAEGLAWTQEALARAGELAPHLRLAALNNLFRQSMFAGYDMAHFAPLAREALALSEQIDDPSERFETVFFATVVAVNASDFDWANSLAERGLSRAHESQNDGSIATMLDRCGWVRLSQGDLEGARTFFRQACQRAQEKEVPASWLFDDLAVLDEPSARAYCEQELARVRLQINREELASALETSASLCLRAGDYDQAGVALAEALVLWRALGVPYSLGRGTSGALSLLGQVAWLQRDPEAARSYYEQSQELHRQAGDVERTAWLHLQIGYALLAQGDLASAAARFERGLKLYRELARPDGFILVVAARAALAEARGHRERAATLFAAAKERLPAPLIKDIIYQHQIAAARARYSGPEFAAAWAAGEQMTLEQAVDYALQDGGAAESPAR